MNIREIGSRGTIFTFDDDISVFLINGSRRLYLCDTHCGPESMALIRQYAADGFPGKEFVVFNSHSDWDHVWGNCAFKDSIIVGHDSCRNRLRERGEFDLKRHARYHRGEVKIVFPDLTFDNRLTFEDDIELIYAPGHTVDSAICFDRRDSVLYAGDLVEYPVPNLSYGNLDEYIHTLEMLKELKPEIILTAHSGIVEQSLIDDNIDYIRRVISGNAEELHDSQDFRAVHEYNRKSLLILKYEKIAREKLKEDFDYETFRKDSNTVDIRGGSYDDFEKALDDYIAKL